MAARVKVPAQCVKRYCLYGTYRQLLYRHVHTYAHTNALVLYKIILWFQISSSLNDVNKTEMLTSSQETLCALHTEVHSEWVNKQEITCTGIITASNALGLQSSESPSAAWLDFALSFFFGKCLFVVFHYIPVNLGHQER